ncbi:MAG: class I SAM-dependent methyltransferase [Bacteroidales bacterium]
MKSRTLKSYPQKSIRLFTSEKGFPLSVGIFIIFFLFANCHVGAQGLDVPYVSTPRSVVEKMLEVAEVGPGDYVIDMGSGDGRIVIAAAQRGACGHGVDLDPDRIREARSNASSSNVSNKVMFVMEDIFETDFSKANVITMYLLNSVNRKLRPQLLDELEPGTRIVSHDFDMGDWKPDQQFVVDNSRIDLGSWEIDNPIASDEHDIYYWIVPAKVEGEWVWKTDGKNFTMHVNQKFQKIYPKINMDGITLRVENNLLKGERITLSTLNPSNNNRYVFNGRVEDDKIIGTVQIRKENNNTIEDWSASLR